MHSEESESMRLWMGFDKGWKVMALAFALGYLAHSYIPPRTPAYHLSALEKQVSKDPVRYEQIVDQIMEFAHDMKAAANPGPAAQGYVEFKDAKLELEKQQGYQGNITELVNKKTGEKKPLTYINGKMAIGTYNDLKSIVDGEESKNSMMDGFFRFFSEIDRRLGNWFTDDYDSIVGR